jgi:hypothetical protein
VINMRIDINNNTTHTHVCIYIYTYHTKNIYYLIYTI